MGPRSVRKIAIDICSYGLELPISGASLKLIPQGSVYSNFYWAGSPAAGALTALLASIGMTWYEDDGGDSHKRSEPMPA